MDDNVDTLPRYRSDLEAAGYNPKTVKVKVGVVALAAAHADVAPEDLTREDLLAWLGATTRADWTRIKYLSHVSAFFAWLDLPDPTEGIRRPRQPIGVPKPVSERDLALLLDATASPRTRAWLVLGAYCGLRSFETAKVRADDLEQLYDGSWRLLVEGKGGQTAWVPTPAVVVSELRPWVEAAGGRGPLWPGASAKAVQAAIRRAAAAAGVECTSHQLRHRFGTASHRVSGDLLKTQHLMRHRSPATTAGYALVAGSELGAVVAALPGAEGAAQGRARLRLVRPSAEDGMVGR